nr:MAG TPA: hypothetical protein [Caudoviricetes sp.]
MSSSVKQSNSPQVTSRSFIFQLLPSFEHLFQCL